VNPYINQTYSLKPVQARVGHRIGFQLFFTQTIKVIS